MTIRAGVLADTHLLEPDNRFRLQVQHCFHDCTVIIHAGDITGPGVLAVFADKQVHAVHGNICDGEHVYWNSTNLQAIRYALLADMQLS